LSYLVEAVDEGFGNGASIAHGCGRKWPRSLSRQKARERFGAKGLIETELGGRVVCEERDLLYEEAPLAYKNIERVIRDLLEAGLVRVIASLRPVFTYKMRETRR
jgi:release factor H-coupled RctB family protein